MIRGSPDAIGTLHDIRCVPIRPDSLILTTCGPGCEKKVSHLTLLRSLTRPHDDLIAVRAAMRAAIRLAVAVRSASSRPPPTPTASCGPAVRGACERAPCWHWAASRSRRVLRHNHPSGSLEPSPPSQIAARLHDEVWLGIIDKMRTSCTSSSISRSSRRSPASCRAIGTAPLGPGGAVASG